MYASIKNKSAIIIISFTSHLAHVQWSIFSSPKLPLCIFITLIWNILAATGLQSFPGKLG